MYWGSCFCSSIVCPLAVAYTVVCAVAILESLRWRRLACCDIMLLFWSLKGVGEQVIMNDSSSF